MRSFRSKPVGWMNDNHRHYLAAKYGSAGKKDLVWGKDIIWDEGKPSKEWARHEANETWLNKNIAAEEEAIHTARARFKKGGMKGDYEDYVEPHEEALQEYENLKAGNTFELRNAPKSQRDLIIERKRVHRGFGGW